MFRKIWNHSLLHVFNPFQAWALGKGEVPFFIRVIRAIHGLIF
jgi:hypothetical protein